jgi:fructan beta-fructosidase
MPADGKVVLRQEAIEPFGGSGLGTFQLGPQPLAPGILELSVTAAVARIDVEFEPGTAGSVGLVLRAGGAERTLLTYDVAEGTLCLDRRESGHVSSTRPSPLLKPCSCRCRKDATGSGSTLTAAP